MTVRTALYGLTVTATLAVAGVTGCDDGHTAPLAVDAASVAAHRGAAHAGLAHGPEVSQWLAGLRNATAKFQDLEEARAAGWNARITGCMALPGTGGMGFHYGNVGLIDDTPEEFAPELLVYEPQKNGRMRLVAVEYIVPFDAWTAEAPPSLHGIVFHRNEAFGLWVLHAWVWKHNPAGIFQDWNPDVSCEFAEPTES